jgi:hypothetical protein
MRRGSEWSARRKSTARETKEEWTEKDVPFSTPNTPATACFSKNHTLMTLKIWMPLPDIYIMKAEKDREKTKSGRRKKKRENGQHRSRRREEAKERTLHRDVLSRRQCELPRLLLPQRIQVGGLDEGGRVL